MLKLAPTGSFKRDLKRAKKRGKDIGKLQELLNLLIEQAILPERYRDHPLKGRWQGNRDAHIEPDWLLIYRVEGSDLKLLRTGTQADLFDE